MVHSRRLDGRGASVFFSRKFSSFPPSFPPLSSFSFSSSPFGFPLSVFPHSASGEEGEGESFLFFATLCSAMLFCAMLCVPDVTFSGINDPFSALLTFTSNSSDPPCSSAVTDDSMLVSLTEFTVSRGWLLRLPAPFFPDGRASSSSLIRQ